MPWIGATGSRVFGSANEQSDVDLYVQDSPFVRSRLLSAGFRNMQIRGKAGSNMTGMFRRGKIDVGLYADAERKRKENALLKFSPLCILMKHLSKANRDKVWQKVQQL